jgi:hypothetical protein
MISRNQPIDEFDPRQSGIEVTYHNGEPRFHEIGNPNMYDTIDELMAERDHRAFEKFLTLGPNDKPSGAFTITSFGKTTLYKCYLNGAIEKVEGLTADEAEKEMVRINSEPLGI